MGRAPIPTWYFALAVERRGHRSLLTQEKKYGSTWSIPDGILRVEHSPAEDTVRMRVLFAASPIDDTPPKTVADEESLGAAWLTIDEIRTKRLRGAELRALLESALAGRQGWGARREVPLELLGSSELSV